MPNRLGLKDWKVTEVEESTTDMRFKKVVAGAWEQPVMRGYKMACCDCGLVHTVDFRVVGKRVQLRAYRNNRSTAAMRRWMKAEGK